MTKLFKEPLFHFIVLGAALFLGHSLWAHRVEKTDYTITIPPEDISREVSLFKSETGVDPNQAERKRLISNLAEEQILMREAKRLGLDQNDSVIARRLAQKMRLTLSRMDPPPLPKEAELQTWFEQNKTEFTLPETRNFHHIYFSPDQHDDPGAAAIKAKAELTDRNWQSLSDSGDMPSSFNAANKNEITRAFGRDFAGDVFALPPGTWSAPLQSAIGVHLVRVDAITPRQSPTFKQVRGLVEEAWLEEAMEAAMSARLKGITDQYVIAAEQ